MLKLKLSKNVTKKDHKWLKRDFIKDETVFLYTSHTYNCIGKSGLACSLDGKEPFFELPITALQFNHEGRDYGIFMTEKQGLAETIYCSELPLNGLDVLTEIQKNGHLVPSYNGKSEKLSDKQVLKISFIDSVFVIVTIWMQDIEPLF